MPTVTVHFGGICTFFMADAHPQLNGFCRAVLVNAADGRTVSGHDIPPHEAVIQIGDGPRVTVHGLHMRLLSSNDESVQMTEFTGKCPDLTQLVHGQHRELSPPSQEVVFAGNPEAAALYFDFKGGTLHSGKNILCSVVTTLVVQGDEVALEAAPFGGAPPSQFPLRTVFHEDTTILVSNDDAIPGTSPNDFLLHYLTAEHIPPDPPHPPALCHLPLIPHLPHWYGSIGSGCSNSTYP